MNETASGAATASATLQERVQSLRLNKEVRIPPRRGGSLFWLILLAVILGGGFWLWLTYGEAAKRMFSSSTAPQVSASATKVAPEREKIAGNVALEAGGYIVPFQKVQVSPKVGGQVKKLFIEEGQYVKKGAVLAELETEEYDFEYNRAVAISQLAKAKLDEAEKGSRAEEILQADAAEKEATEALKQSKDELSKLQASGSAITRDELDKAQSRVLIAV